MVGKVILNFNKAMKTLIFPKNRTQKSGQFPEPSVNFGILKCLLVPEYPPRGDCCIGLVARLFSSGLLKFKRCNLSAAADSGPSTSSLV